MKSMRSALAAALFAVCLTPVAQALVVNGVDWRQATETTGFSWNQVASVCNSSTGVCAGSIGGVSFNGWTWASNEEIRALFEFLILPGSQQFASATSSYTVSASNSADIAAALGSPYFLPTQTNANSDHLLAWARTTGPLPTQAYVPRLVDVFVDSAFLSDRAELGFLQDKINSALAIGVWLYRDPTPVPLPGAAWLLISGLGMLGLTRMIGRHSRHEADR